MNEQEFFDKLIENLAQEYKFNNAANESVGCNDYTYTVIPFQKVEADRAVAIEYIADIMNNERDISMKEIAIVMYLNFFIRYGMASRFKKEGKYSEYDGLENVLNNLSEEKEHLTKVYLVAKYQDDNAWNEILAYNGNSIVSKIYIFVRMFYQYSRDISAQIDKSSIDLNKYKEMWELYEEIPDDWRKYILEDDDKIDNRALSKKLLPHMRFGSIKESLIETISKYYKAILDKLGVSATEKPETAYNEINNRLGLNTMRAFAAEMGTEMLINFQNVDKLSETVLTNTPRLVKEVGKYGGQLEKIDWDLKILVEKMHWLIYKNLERPEWSKSKDILEKYDWDNMNPVLRTVYLHIPVYADMNKSLFESQFEVYIKNRTLKRNEKRRMEMMDYYAHTWKHISYPQIVKEIAEELGKTDRITANRLMKVYNSERTLQRGIELLQYISSNDENEVRKKFINGIAKSGSNATSYFNIFQVICDSLDLVVFKILMVESDDSTSIKRCREKWKLRSPLDELREEYTTLFLEEKTDNCNIFEWTKANLINLELDISNEWNDVRFWEDGFAINQFKEILVEIFTNIFLHGDDKARLNFFENEHEMIIRETNGCIDTNPGSQSGISTMRRVLEYLNVGTDIQSLETEIEEDYTLTIRLDKRLLIRRGRRS